MMVLRLPVAAAATGVQLIKRIVVIPAIVVVVVELMVMVVVVRVESFIVGHLIGQGAF